MATKKETAPTEVLVDCDGNTTTDPEACQAGAALLPFGEHKGYGLMLAIEVVANLFAGAFPASSARYQPGNPTLFTAWHVEAFIEQQHFETAVDELRARMKSSKPIHNVTEVLIPGNQRKGHCRNA